MSSCATIYHIVSLSILFDVSGEWKILHYHQSWSSTPIEAEKEDTEK